MMAMQAMMARAQVHSPPSEPLAPPPTTRNVLSIPVTAAPSESTQTTPRKASSPPRVTTNEGTPM